MYEFVWLITTIMVLNSLYVSGIQYPQMGLNMVLVF